MNLSKLSILELHEQAYQILREQFLSFFPVRMILSIVFLFIPVPIICFYIITAPFMMLYPPLSTFYNQPFLAYQPTPFFYYNLFFSIYILHFIWMMIFQLHSVFLFNRMHMRSIVNQYLTAEYASPLEPEDANDSQLFGLNLLACWIAYFLSAHALLLPSPALSLIAMYGIVLLYLAYLYFFQFTSYIPLEQKITNKAAIQLSLQYCYRTWYDSLKIFLSRALVVLAINIACISSIILVIRVSHDIFIGNSTLIYDYNRFILVWLILGFPLIQIVSYCSLIYSGIVQYLYYLQLHNETHGIEIQAQLNTMQQSYSNPENH